MSDVADNVWDLRVLEHEGWLRTVVRSRVASSDEADDVLQSVIADAIAFGDRQAEVRSLGPWLYRLAVNAVLQFRRKCGRRRKLHNNYAVSAGCLDLTEPLDILLGAERIELVQSALAGMSGEDVEILMLKYVHGWDYAQISGRLGLAGQRVAHRLRRARSRLKQQLHQRGLGTDEVN